MPITAKGIEHRPGVLKKRVGGIPLSSPEALAMPAMIKSHQMVALNPLVNKRHKRLPAVGKSVQQQKCWAIRGAFGYVNLAESGIEKNFL